jgi:hypothetical protein
MVSVNQDAINEDPNMSKAQVISSHSSFNRSIV